MTGCSPSAVNKLAPSSVFTVVEFYSIKLMGMKLFFFFHQLIMLVNWAAECHNSLQACIDVLNSGSSGEYKYLSFFQYQSNTEWNDMLSALSFIRSHN